MKHFRKCETCGSHGHGGRACPVYRLNQQQERRRAQRRRDLSFGLTPELEREIILIRKAWKIAAALGSILLCATSLFAGTITGRLQTATGGAVTNGTLSFRLSQPAVLVGSASLVTSPASCYISAAGNIVGVPDPLVAPVLTANTISGTLPAGTYFVVVTYAGASGESVASPESTVVLSAQGTVIVAAPVKQPANATGYNVYIGTAAGAETMQASVTGFTQYSQTSALASGAALPASNSSVCSLAFSDQLIPSGTYYAVSLVNKNGSTIAGFPQTWCTYGGQSGTINVSNGAPTGNCGTNGVIYPTPIFAVPQNNAQQSISGPFAFTGPTLVIPGGNTLSATTLSDYSVAGFSKLNSGFFATSSLVTKGALDLYNNATGVIFRNGVFNSGTLGKTGTLQAGDTASGTATWLANSVYNLPDLAQGSGVDASGFLYGAPGSKLNASVGNCVYGSGINTSNNAGILENSGFGCNTNIVFPTFGQAVEWSASGHTGALNPTTLTVDRTWTLPNNSGIVALQTATGTATVDLASVASGACTADSSDVTLTGAAVGDPLRVSAATALPAGVWLVGRVTASNTGRFQLCNLSGGAVDRASDTYTISVVK